MAYRYFDTRKETWLDLTWAEMREQVARWQAALLREKLALTPRVAEPYTPPFDEVFVRLIQAAERRGQVEVQA